MTTSPQLRAPASSAKAEVRARKSPWRYLRAVWRILRFVGLLFWAIATSVRIRRDNDHSARMRWAQKIAQGLCAILNIRSRYDGPAIERGLFISNHMSYIDIMVICAHVPCAFVSKSEIAGWPVVGSLAHAGGTIFVSRGRRMAAAGVADAMTEALRERRVVALFPEGTTTDGSTLLPFYKTLFQSAVTAEARVYCGALRYACADGDVATEVAYWGPMTLVPHLFHLATLEFIDAELKVYPEGIVYADKRTAAAESRARVAALLGMEAMPE